MVVVLRTVLYDETTVYAKDQKGKKSIIRSRRMTMEPLIQTHIPG